jgi:hypothetical protein
VCEKELNKAKNLLVQSDIFADRKYSVKICECGIGTTEIIDNNVAREANEAMYDDVSQRIDIYFHNHKIWINNILTQESK